MKTNFTHRLLLILFVGVLTSCTNYEIKPKVPAEVKFSLNIIPIFTGSCAKSGCHVTGGLSPDLSPSNAYNSLINAGYVDTSIPAEQNILYQKITTGDMQIHATDEDRVLILKWIQQGAQNN